MVRKRSRTASTRRKTYDSDDEDLESDSEINSSPEASPQPKRYGLRQRTKKTIFFEDYEDFEEPQKSKADSSEDDEYQIEEDLKSFKTVNHKTRRSRLKITPRRKSLQLSVLENDPSEDLTVSVGAILPLDLEQDQDLNDGLIDYEDMIRADVVVNKKLDEEGASKADAQEIRKGGDNSMDKGRRGRKPKKKFSPAAVDDDASAKLEVQIDPANFVHQNEIRKTNGLSPASTRSRKKPAQNGAKIELAPSILDGIEKFVPPNLDDKEKEVVLSNEYLLGNSFDMTADQFLERQKEPQKEEEEDQNLLQNLPPMDFDESGSDDDVVIIEKKPEIIVLDDD
ncbi:unnamed protein product [Ceutorhynchus assimilis]|uniref:Uncharacterized protein n=1 Tax=Ceutorhynchus assimilis TaxID=467358 RepID=A0A9N9MHP8_9CUCU|nr:unnamed protein product [Ceutorhynchus assimilis]